MNLRTLFSLVLLLAGGFCLQAGTKLSRAAVDGDLAKVQERVKAGESVNDIDKWGWTALHWAAYYGHPKVALWLLENGADPNIKTVKSYGRYQPGVTVLILAAYYGHSDIVEALLKKKADASVVDAAGHTALDYAKEFNFDACVKLLEK